MYGSRSFIELSVGNSHTVEVIINIRECDLSWWNETLESHEKELFKLIQCHILPSEFHEEIYNYHKQRQNEGIRKKIIIGEKNKKKRKANTKNDDTNNNNNKSKKKAQSRSHETSNKVDEGTASKRKYDLDVSYLFGETLQITYKMEEIPVSSSATIMYRPTAIFKETSKENDKEDGDVKSSEISEPKRLCDFFHRPKLNKRILLWCYPFDPSKPSEPNPPGGGFPRPEMVPLSSLFYEPKS